MVQQFIRQPSGDCIVNISSVHARAGYVNHSIYGVTKAGVEAFLFSDDAGLVAGQTIVADGGLTTRYWTFEPDPALASLYGLDAP
jgi:hypothetical protein